MRAVNISQSADINGIYILAGGSRSLLGRLFADNSGCTDGCDGLAEPCAIVCGTDRQ